MKDVIEKIFTVNLGVKSNERVSVFTDLLREDEAVSEEDRKRREELIDIAREAAETGKRFCKVAYLEFPSTGGHGREPPEEVWEICIGPEATEGLRSKGILEKILRKAADEETLKEAEEIVKKHSRDAVDAVVALTNYSTSHTRFRDLLTRVAGARYASMPLFDRRMLDGVMRADWEKVRERTESLGAMLEGAKTVNITCPNGTDISFSVDGRSFKLDTGILATPGSFGNLPAGEAFIAPVEGTAKGTLVLDWAPTRRLCDPVTLIVDRGLVIEVSGREDFACELRETLKKEPLAANIAELGIGTNDRAARPDNILETEKILGTVHIALGDNSSFGGSVSVPFHQDFIFFHPTMKIKKDGKEVLVLDRGRPLF